MALLGDFRGEFGKFGMWVPVGASVLAIGETNCVLVSSLDFFWNSLKKIAFF